MLCSVGAVMVVNWIADRRVVQEFASRLVMRVLAGEEKALRNHLDEAIQQGDYIAGAIRSGRYKLSDAALADFIARHVRGSAACRRANLDRCEWQRITRRSRHTGRANSGRAFRHSYGQPSTSACQQHSRPQGAFLGRAGLSRAQRGRLSQLSRSDFQWRFISGIRRSWHFSASLVQAHEGDEQSADFDIVHGLCTAPHFGASLDGRRQTRSIGRGIASHAANIWRSGYCRFQWLARDPRSRSNAAGRCFRA